MAAYLTALVPLIAVQIWLSLSMCQDALEQGRSLLLRAVYQAAAVQDAMTEALRQELTTLADDPALRDKDPVGTEAALERLARNAPFAANVFVCDLDGTMTASLKKPFAGMRVDHRRYFVEALRRGDFAVGEFVVARTLGKPSLHFAKPIVGPSQAPVGVAGVAVALGWYQRLLQSLTVPDGAFLALFDRQGLLLARYPESPDLRPGDRFPAHLDGQFSWNQSSGSFTAKAPDGIDTLYAYKPLHPGKDDAEPYGILFMGMPVQAALAAAHSRTQTAAWVSVGAVALAVAAAALLCRLAIVNRLRVLADFAVSLGQDRVCLLPPRFGGDEIGLLGRRMADMSLALHEKNEHLAEAMDSLARERDALAGAVKQLRRAEEELTRRADHDGLTGLKNRRCFVERLAAEMARLRRYATPLSLILVDIDDFKRVNDTWGHAAGDAVLRAVALALAGGLRDLDAAYRVGGEEFAVLLPATGGTEAMAVAERLRLAVAGLTDLWPDGPGSVRVTVSLGVAEATPAMDAEKDLFATADRALYAAKAAGKNRCALADVPAD
jgi:diguanylate cyclase (GGDEF)-like protein